MWPKLVFTDASAHGSSMPYTSARLRVLDRVTDRGAGAVRLDHADGGGVHAGDVQRRPVDRGLRGRRRRGDVDGVTVLVGRGPADHRQDAVAVALRIGQPLEQHHGAALAGHEPVGRHVEGVAATGGRQHALRRCRRRTCAVPAARGRHRRAPDRSRRSCRLRQAMCTAIKPDEHAVSTVIAGPCKPKV